MAGGKNKNILRFSRPARWWGSSWREALVTGNGIIGCSVLGGAAEDSVMLTHADLWWQGKVGVLPEVCSNFAKTKALIAEGRFVEAGQVLPDALIAKGFRPSTSYPLPLCDLAISMQTSSVPKDYCRSLNTDTGEVSVSFRDGSTKYTRSVFAPKNQDLVVFEISKSGSKTIDVDFSLRLHDKFNNRTPSSFTNVPEGAVTKNEGKLMYFSAKGEGGTEFGAVAIINFFGGTLTTVEDVTKVRGAEKIFVAVRPYINVKSREVKWKEFADGLKTFKLTYEKLLKEQLLGKNRTYLELSDDESFVDELLQKPDDIAALTEKLWSFGRFLFGSASTPSSQPVAPYGIWCGDYKGVDSHLCADGSLQLMYEHALAGNMGDYLSSLFASYETVIDDLKKNAIRLFDCHGVMIPPVVAHGTGLIGQTTPQNTHFIDAAGWLCKLMYDAYLFSTDQKILKRIIPFMKETANFYLDYFVLQEDGFYQSCPSYSPNSRPANTPEGTVAVKNALIDFAVAKELFSNLLEIAQETPSMKDDIEKYKAFLQHIPPYRTAEDGTVLEYFDNSFDTVAKSASTAMFYPVFPGTEVTETSEIYKAFEKTAAKRFCFGTHQTASSLARFAALFVRLGQGSMAEEIMTVMSKHMAMNNLIFSQSDWSGMGVASADGWARYSIEPNLILTNAIQEMFVQSTRDTIFILPACSFAKGELGGFLTRTGVEVTDLFWDKKRGSITVKLKAKKARTITLKFADKIKKYKGGGQVDADNGLIKTLDLPANKIITIDLRV